MKLEVMSFKEALSWAKALNFKRYIFETDAETLLDACKEYKKGHIFRTIILRCFELFKNLDDS